MDVVIVVILILILLLLFTALVGAPYVPSLSKNLKVAFTELYPLSEADLLVDLGSGDGKVLAAAVGYGARAVGVELSPLLVLFSKIRLWRVPRARVFMANLYTYKLPAETTVVYLFSDSRDIEKTIEHLKGEAGRLGKAVFLISCAFKAPGLKKVKKRGVYYLYRIEPDSSR